MPEASSSRAGSGRMIESADILADRSLARLFHWGLSDFGSVLRLQEKLRASRRADAIPDTWLAGEHPTVITQGVRGKAEDLRRDAISAAATPYPVFEIDRGGMTTIHNPGQLVIYPIVKTQASTLAQARFSRALLHATRDWLARLSGVSLDIHKGRPGLFHGGRKVAAIGISIHGHVSMHGIAINLNNDLTPWRAIIPCGEPATRAMTLSEAAGRSITPAEVSDALPEWLSSAWGYDLVETAGKIEELA